MSFDTLAGSGQTPGVRIQGSVHASIRTAGPEILARALHATRTRTLALMQAWERLLPGLSVPMVPDLNPPLWEWGHIAWFQEWWTVRNRERFLGTGSASRGDAFAASLLAGADALYDSGKVAHDSRWALALPHMHDTRWYLDEVLRRSLEYLRAVPDGGDPALYFWRLALQHEAMHDEASVYMAQALGLDLPVDVRGCAARAAQAPHPAPWAQATCVMPARTWTLGHHGPGFAFDNELGAHTVELAAFSIDVAPVSWGRYLPFLQATGHPPPPHLREVKGVWQIRQFARWEALDPDAPAVHVSAYDAEAWCRWAGRRLPAEAEWECAVHAGGLQWGEVWEWTASPFAPYPGFTPHPYEDYSAPWWHTHRVLRGASRATSAYLVDARYRNYFAPQRRDIFAGFRSAGD